MSRLEATYHDDKTMAKVYDGLKAAGLTENQIIDAVTQIQNRGIYFREVPPDAYTEAPVHPEAKARQDAYKRGAREGGRQALLDAAEATESWNTSPPTRALTAAWLRERAKLTYGDVGEPS